MAFLWFVLALAADPRFIYIRYPAGITVMCNSSPVRPGAPIVLTATVSGNQPTGVVLFSDGDGPLGMVGLDNLRQAVLALPAGLHAGDHVVTALYNGDPYNSLASTTLTLHVLRPRPSPHWPHP